MQHSSASHGAAARGAKPGSGALPLTALLFERAAKSLLLSHELNNLVQFKLCLFRKNNTKIQNLFWRCIVGQPTGQCKRESYVLAEI